MKKTLKVLLLAALAAMLAFTAVAETRITVSSTGETLVNADYALVTLGVQSLEEDVLKAQNSVNTRINKIRAALIENGIDKENINTDQIRIYAQYDYSSDAYTIKGYNASSYLSIRTNDMENIGAVIDIAFENGANSLSDINFFCENTDDARAAALTYAVQDARVKADIIAKAAGLAITGIETIRESYYSTAESRSNALFKNVAEAEDCAGETYVQSAKLSVSAHVEIVFIAE